MAAQEVFTRTGHMGALLGRLPQSDLHLSHAGMVLTHDASSDRH